MRIATVADPYRIEDAKNFGLVTIYSDDVGKYVQYLVLAVDTATGDMCLQGINEDHDVIYPYACDCHAIDDDYFVPLRTSRIRCIVAASRRRLSAVISGFRARNSA